MMHCRSESMALVTRQYRTLPVAVMVTVFMLLVMLGGLAARAEGEGVREVWSRRYTTPGAFFEQPKAMQTDAAGNVYVTGSSYHNDGYTSDIVTVKYAADGRGQWVRPYNYASTGFDYPVGMKVDREGNLLVVGMSTSGDVRKVPTAYYEIVLLKYRADGALLWTKRYPPPVGKEAWVEALAGDQDGNVVAVGAIDGDFATMRFRADGNLDWVARQGNKEGPDRASSVALDGEGNVVVGGAAWDGLGEGKQPIWASVVVKYSRSGQKLWESRTPNPVDAGSNLMAVAADGAGNAYAATPVVPTGGGTAVLANHLTRFGPGGGVTWSAIFPGSLASNMAVATGPQGTVTVIGSVLADDGRSANFLTARYGPDGKRQWLAQYMGGEGRSALATALAVGADGSAYVTGFAEENPRTAFNNYATVRYDAAGRQQWVAYYGDSGAASDYPVAVVLDPAGNVLVTGSVWGASTLADFGTVKYVSERLAAPWGLAAKPNGRRQIRLTWSNPGGREDGLELERRRPPGAFGLLRRLPAGTTNWDDTSLDDFVTYTYRVRATAGTERSDYSNEVTATAPGPPLALTLAASKSTAAKFETVAFAGMVKNMTARVAAGAVLRVVLPRTIEPVTSTLAGLTWDSLTRTLRWQGLVAPSTGPHAFRFLARIGAGAARGSVVTVGATAECPDYATATAKQSVTVASGQVPASVLVKAEGAFQLLTGRVAHHEELGTPPLQAGLTVGHDLTLWLGVRSITASGSASYAYPDTLSGVLTRGGVIVPGMEASLEGKFLAVNDAVTVTVGMTREAAAANIAFQLLTVLGAVNDAPSRFAVIREVVEPLLKVDEFRKAAMEFVPLPKGAAALTKAIYRASKVLLKAIREDRGFLKRVQTILLNKLGLRLTQKVIKKAFQAAFAVESLTRYLADLLTLVVATKGDDMLLRFEAQPTAAGESVDRIGPRSGKAPRLVTVPGEEHYGRLPGWASTAVIGTSGQGR